MLLTVLLSKNYVTSKAYGLQGYSTLEKADLKHATAKVHADEFGKWLVCAIETGRYLPLTCKGYDKHQHIWELYQLDGEVTAALWGWKYEHEIKKNPTQWSEPLKKAENK